MTGILRAVSQSLVLGSSHFQAWPRRSITTSAPFFCSTAISASNATTAATTKTTPTQRSNNALLAQHQQRRRQQQQQHLQHQQHRNFSWDQRGYDLTADMLSNHGERPKVVIEAFASTGFDVRNTVRRLDETETSDGTVHMNGSIMVFPFGCFLWKVEKVEDVTVESLAPIILHRPKLDYLFIGCNKHGGKGGVSREVMTSIQSEMGEYGIVVEQLNLGNAIGTFNILNAEDRLVACALVIDPMDDPEVMKYQNLT